MKRVVLSLLLLSCMGWMPVCADMPRLGDGFDPALTNFNRLAFWVDANVNCITNAEGAVTQWADVREVFADGIPTTNDHTFVHNRGRVHESATVVPCLPPTFKTDERHPGMKFLDFGDYGSGRWMYIANPSGDFFHQKVGSYYCILGFDTENNSGHILSDISALNGSAGGGKVFFHKQYGGLAGGYISASNAGSSMYRGATYLDGVRIDPRNTFYHWDRYQMFGQVGPLLSTNDTISTPTQPFFSTILNDRNFGNGARQGGAVIGELLVWNDILTEEERYHVEAYLRAKWFGLTTTKAAVLVAGETLVVGDDVKESFVEAATGDGTLVKRGEGTTTLARHTGGNSVAIQLEAGTLAVAGGRMDDLPVNPVPGTKITLSEGGAVASAAASVSVAEITGSGATVRPANLANKTVVADNTQIRVVPTPASVYEDATLAARYPNILQNGSFEEHGEHWTFEGSQWADLTEVKGSFWYTGDDEVPDGSRFLFLQANPKDSAYGRVLGSASQTFTAPVDGLYRLTFYMTRRTNRSETDGTLVALFSVDGTNFYRNAVYDDHRGSKDVFKHYSAYLPPLKKGPHTLVLTVDESRSNIDRALILDDLRLTPVAEGDYVYVPNAGMDSSAKPVRLNSTTGWHVDAVAADWTYSAVEGTEGGSAGLTQMSSLWNWLNSTEKTILADYRKVYLQKDYQMETTVTLPHDGRVRLSFAYANRSNQGYPGISGSARGTGHRVEASLYNDGTNVLVATALPVTPLVRTCQGTCDLPAGTYTLRIRNNRQGLTTDISAIIDDVLIAYEGSVPGRLVPPVSFVDGRDPAWRGDLVQHVSEIETGADEILIPRGATGERTVTAPSNGLYRIVLKMSGQNTAHRDFDGVALGTSWYPVRAEVKVDGVRQGVYTFQDDTPRPISFALPYLTAGDHVVRIDALTSGSAAKAMVRVADLDLRPLESATIPTKDVTKETRLRLTNGAKLDLVYEGQMFVREFSVNGTKYTGTLSRETTGLADVLTGPGELVVVPRGTVLLLR